MGALRSAQFPITRRYAYLDNSTFGPPPRACAEAVARCLRELSEGAQVPVSWAAEVDRVRGLVARLYNCTTDDVAFMKSSAEALGLVALGLDWQPGDEVVVYERDFPAAVLPWLNLADLGVRVRFVRDHGRHRFEMDDVSELVCERTRVVCLGMVNFGNGLMAPIEGIAEICRRQVCGCWSTRPRRPACSISTSAGWAATCWSRMATSSLFRVTAPLPAMSIANCGCGCASRSLAGRHTETPTRR